MRGKLSNLFVFLTVLFFMLLTTVFWARLKLFTKKSFVHLSVKTFQQEEVREAISLALVDRALEKRPLIKEQVREPLATGLSGVLASQIFEKVLEKSSKVLFKLMTTETSEGFSLNTKPIKKFALAIGKELNPQFGSNVSLADLPDQVEVFAPAELPPINKIPKKLSWMGFFSALLFLIFALLAFYKANNLRPKLKLTGFFLAIFSLIFLLLLFPIKDMLVHSMAKPLGQELMKEFFEVLTRSFNLMYLVFLLAGIILFYFSSGRRPVSKEN